MWQHAENIFENEALHNRRHVFSDRAAAGLQLARLFTQRPEHAAVVAAIPAGGVPVGVVLARTLKLPLDILVVSKITLPWTTEAGYGAVAADGSVILNMPLMRQLALDDATVQTGIERTKDKVARRDAYFRQYIQPMPVAGKTVIVVDDGLASGITLRVAIDALRKQQAKTIIVAVPTGHSASLLDLAGQCERIYCANVREGLSYAVADAYVQWTDVSEQEVAALLQKHASQSVTPVR